MSAHRLVHHPAAATADDPFTADEGEGFWSYLSRAWPAALVAGWEMETALARTRPGGRAPILQPYVLYVIASLAVSLALWLIAGMGGVLLHVVLSALVQGQLFLADYVRHYGRQRRRTGPGEVEPYGPAHEWTARDPFARLRGRAGPPPGDHMIHDGGALEPRHPGTHRLPGSFPLMSARALVPPLFLRAMTRNLAVVQARRPDRLTNR